MKGLVAAKSEIDKSFQMFVIYSEHESYASDFAPIFKSHGLGFLVPGKKQIYVDGESLKDLTYDHLLAIQAHEISHYRLKHKGDYSEKQELEADVEGYKILVDGNYTKAAVILRQRIKDHYGKRGLKMLGENKINNNMKNIKTIEDFLEEKNESVNEGFTKKDWDVKWKMPKDNLFNATKTKNAVDNRYKALQNLLKDKPKELKAFDATDDHPAYDMSYDELMKWYNNLNESVNEVTLKKGDVLKFKTGSKWKVLGPHGDGYSFRIDGKRGRSWQPSGWLDMMFRDKKVVVESVTEKFMDSQIDQIAQKEFGMDWDQLGKREKEWVRDEIDNLTEAASVISMPEAAKVWDALVKTFSDNKNDSIEYLNKDKSYRNMAIRAIFTATKF